MFVVVDGGGGGGGGVSDRGALCNALLVGERLSCGPRHGHHHTYSTGRDGC